MLQCQFYETEKLHKDSIPTLNLPKFSHETKDDEIDIDGTYKTSTPVNVLFSVCNTEVEPFRSVSSITFSEIPGWLELDLVHPVINCFSMGRLLNIREILTVKIRELGH
ncbi:uncharacterized protein LOC114354679 [Ostrinia furnacalis]|uniref:uncharacterized protein LOC114354679 n=1 Tax=Ostrinia furnacalis TaxID=93504 RepID=UPI0010389080|nr:uncharacterized protein LOC114354679 [Ostrinia furnacalis]